MNGQPPEEHIQVSVYCDRIQLTLKSFLDNLYREYGREATLTFMMDTLITTNPLALSRWPLSVHLTSLRLTLYVLLASLVIAVAGTFTNRSEKTPSVKYGWPIVGNIVSYTRDPVSYLRKARAQYGKIFKVNMILTRTVWLRDTRLSRVYLETKEVSALSTPRQTLTEPSNNLLT